MRTSLFNKNSCEKMRKSKSSLCSLVSIFNSEIHPMTTDNKKSWHKLWHTRVLTSCILSGILGVTQTALAGYKPPKDQKPPSGYSDSSGVRGRCRTISEQSLRLLAPVTHVGQTTSTHPTFAWVASDNEPIPIEFSLYEFDSNLKPKKLDSYTQTFPSSSSLMKRSLSKDLPGLTVGKRYLWQVQILCNPNRPSRHPIARAEIKVVPAPLTLVNNLATTDDPSLKANLYGRYGMWYDAIKEALPFTTKEGIGQTLTDLVASLAQLENPVETDKLLNIALINKE